MSDRTLLYALIDGVSSHKAFAFYLDLTNLGIGALPRSSL